jgi:hypothetical protein
MSHTCCGDMQQNETPLSQSESIVLGGWGSSPPGDGGKAASGRECIELCEEGAEDFVGGRGWP